MHIVSQIASLAVVGLLLTDESYGWSTSNASRRSVRTKVGATSWMKQSTTPSPSKSYRYPQHMQDPILTSTSLQSEPSDVSSTDLTIDDLKSDLVRVCTRQPKPSLDDVKSAVRELEDRAEQVRECLLDFCRLLCHVLGFIGFLSQVHRSHLFSPLFNNFVCSAV